jgi:hypothetical protein
MLSAHAPPNTAAARPVEGTDLAHLLAKPIIAMSIRALDERQPLW